MQTSAGKVPTKADPVHAIGRRKTSVARVWLRPGTGKFIVNKRELNEHFVDENRRRECRRPIEVTQVDLSAYDIVVNVQGGGLSGQAGAVRHGLSRALLNTNSELRRVLRDDGLLTRDAREVERKKPGRKKARKRFQFSKR